MTRRSILFAALLAPLVTLVSCGANTVIQALQLAVDAATVAIPLVAGAAGLSAATVTALMNYLQAVSQAISGASTILANGGTPAQQAAQITALFAGIALPNLTGVPAQIVAAIQLVAQRVAAFLANFSQSKLTALGPKAGTSQVLTTDQKQQLAEIKAKAQQNLTVIKK